MASSKHHPMVCPTFVVIVILGYWTTAWAVEFAGGTGEPNDPYQIATAEQLITISSDRSLYDKHFRLTADIDLDPNLPGRKVFRQAVVGWVLRTTTSLYGSFDGAGHVIRNCVLYTSSGGRAGFFAGIAPQGVVRNLHLEDMVIANFAGSTLNSSPAGTLAAINEGAVVDCSATGTLMTYAGGGLIGRNKGLVVGCHARCEVLGNSVGGLIGVNEAMGRVVLCESDSILYDDSGAGGLVATNAGTIQYCSASGFVWGASAGGLVGTNSGSVRESYATATVSGSQSGAGLVSSNTGTIANCYATGPVSGVAADGLVATNQGAILSSYSTTRSQVRPLPRSLRSVRASAQADGDEPESRELQMANDLAVSAFVEKLVRYVYYLDSSIPRDYTRDPHSGYGVALFPEEMKRASSFVGFDFYGDATDGPAGHWFMPPDGYPILTWQTAVTGLTGVPDVSGLSPDQAGLILEAVGLEPNGVTYDYAKPEMVSDAGTTRQVQNGQVILARPAGYLPSASPIEIVVSLGRYDFSKNPGDGSEANPYQIATAGQLDSLYGGPIPAGMHVILTADIDLSDYVYPRPLIWRVSGEFDGNGHTIRGVNSPLFDTIDTSAFVHDLAIDEAHLHVAGATTIGILALWNAGRVLRCEAAGQIIGGHSSIGGLVAGNATSGQLMECRFSGLIRSEPIGQRVGGLVGWNIGTIVRCCVRDVDISGGSFLGGLVGESGEYPAVIETCYATGRVRGIAQVGGLVGQNGAIYSPRVRSLLAQSEIAVSADPVAKGTVRECYAACWVTGEQNVGGLIGFAVAEAVQESCFFLDPSDGGGPDNGLGAPLTASQMKQQASFTGWDFIDTWTICEGRDYPRLRWEGVVCDQ